MSRPSRNLVPPTNHQLPVLKQPTWTEYKGFWISIYPEFESTESRLARGDWKSKIIGYRYTVRLKGKTVAQAEDLPSYELAVQQARTRINAILSRAIVEAPLTND